MIGWLEDGKIDLLNFGLNLISGKLGRKAKERDLSLLKDEIKAIPIIKHYMEELKSSWLREPEDLQETDAWLMSGGYERITERYRPDVLQWLVGFHHFFIEVWNDIPDYLPKFIDLAIYHQLRGKSQGDCPNFCIATERALKILDIRLEEPLTREAELKRFGSSLEEYNEITR